jgi:NAD(P)-dependent dehydrogenase (short-subunit alcohol dehydrogenase family)
MNKDYLLITGGTGKIGNALVKHFCTLGYSVCFTSTSQEKAKTLQEEVAVTGAPQPVFVISDFSKENAAEELVKELRDKSISISQIIQNARSLHYLKTEEHFTVSEENFMNEFRVNVVVPYRLTMELVLNNHPLKQVIFISSMYGVVAPSPRLYEHFESSSVIHYGVTKAAQIHLTKELAVRLAEKNIHVNCISLGGIEGRTNDEFKKRYAQLNPLKEMLTESDFIAPIEFMVQHPEIKMTGHNLIVDGGWSIW